MIKEIPFLCFLLVLSSCDSKTQNAERKFPENEVQVDRDQEKQLVGGPCEGCEAIYEYGDRVLKSIDTLPGFIENQPKIKVSGIVYEKDGKTPAKGVILYIYHTNRKGIYEKMGDEEGWAKRHGYIRGWVKSDDKGQFAFFTFRPASYPSRSEPEHIHITIKEPDKNEYYADAYVFEDDPLLTDETKKNMKNRGGSGIVQFKLVGEIYEAERNLILGLNIPDYD